VKILHLYQVYINIKFGFFSIIHIISSLASSSLLFLFFSFRFVFFFFTDRTIKKGWWWCFRIQNTRELVFHSVCMMDDHVFTLVFFFHWLSVQRVDDKWLISCKTISFGGLRDPPMMKSMTFIMMIHSK
jgi:hypothetical protein